MSIIGNAAAEAVANDIMQYIDELMAQPEFDRSDPREVAERIKAKAQGISAEAKEGWY